MCDLCGTEEQVRKGRERADRVSIDLNRLSILYMQMSIGRLKPHSKEMETANILASSVIRSLVEDFV